MNMWLRASYEIAKYKKNVFFGEEGSTWRLCGAHGTSTRAVVVVVFSSSR